MSNYTKDALIQIAEGWPLNHLQDYITNLERQIDDIKVLLSDLKAIRKRKQKEINRKLKDSGPRGGV